MMSIMQNMNQKHLEDPEKYKQYIRRLIEARMLWNFGVEVCKTVMAYGGTFVLEQPWTSKAWKETSTQGLLANPSTILVKNDQCQFGLVSENGNPHLKPTGWLTNNNTIGEFLQGKCDRTHVHEPILGSSRKGARSKLAQIYPKPLVDAILSGYRKSLNHAGLSGFHDIRFTSCSELLDECYMTEMRIYHMYNEDIPYNTDTHDHSHHNSIEHAVMTNEKDDDEDDDDDDTKREQAEVKVRKYLPGERPNQMEALVRRAHRGLGHIGNERLARILKGARASPEAIEYAKRLECEVCQRHAKVHPPRAAAPPKELRPNQTVGVDTVYLPGIEPNGKLKMALNIIDWCTRFQLVIPLHDHTPFSARKAWYQWVRIFGVPEKICSDLGKEFRGVFQTMGDQEAIIIDPGSLQASTQRSITDRAGKSFKEILSKTIMEHVCTTWEEWYEAVDIVNATINTPRESQEVISVEV